MIDDDGTTPILMDLGSLAPSPTPITSRSLALAVQDMAAEHSTMPYRAPELFDVKTDSIIDTKVDIWSLGCTLYACLVGKSPFEARSEETGGSLSLCVLGGDWRFPDEGQTTTTKTGGTGPNGHRGAGSASTPSTTTTTTTTTTATTTPSNVGGNWSPAVRDVVRRCLIVEPGERPDIDELIQLVESVIQDYPSDDDEHDDDDVVV